VIAGACVLTFPPTARASSPTTNPTSRIEALFAKLADRDPAARDQARLDLMELTRADLPELRRCVKEHRPLAPSQAAVLRDIVTQVYLAGERYPSVRERGFLGVQLSEGGSPVVLPQDQPAGAADASSPPPIGVIVTDRMPGLSSYRALASGDVIVGIAENPEVPIRSVENLKSVIAKFAGAQPIHLEIFRGGRVTTVAITLAARPAEVDINPANLEWFQREKQRRLDLGEDYWQREFPPLVDDGVS